MSNTNKFEIRGTFERTETFTTKAGKEIITLILGTDGQYPQLVPIKCFGRMVDSAKECAKGDMVEVTGRLGGRDWNGKVYGEAVAETIEVVGGKQGAAKRTATPEEDPGPPF
jgi:hypothetical protein